MNNPNDAATQWGELGPIGHLVHIVGVLIQNLFEDLLAILEQSRSTLSDRKFVEGSQVAQRLASVPASELPRVTSVPSSSSSGGFRHASTVSPRFCEFSL